MRRFRGTALAAALSCLVACSFPIPQWGSKSDLDCVLPPLPQAWKSFGALDYSIVLPPGKAATVAPAARVASDVGRVRLSIEKGINLPILAYPILEGRTDLLRPAGAIYPSSLDDHGRLVLSYRDGFLAELLYPLSASEERISALNVERLSQEIWDRSQGDPWVLDREKILVALAYGNMRSDRISMLPSFDLALGAPSACWVAGDPFRPSSTVAPQNHVLDLAGVVLGVHHFFRVNVAPTTSEKAIGGETRSVLPVAAPRERIDVVVSQSGWTSVNSTTGTVESGRW